MNLTRSELRKESLRKRDELGIFEIQRLSLAIPSLLESNFPDLKWSSNWGLWRSFGSELNDDPLAKKILESGGRVAYPKVKNKEEMNFFEIIDIDSSQTWKKSSIGILEPDPNNCPSAPSLDWVVVPGLVFRADGHRIGYGGGFYDRYLAGHPGVKTVSIALSFQRVEGWTQEEWDVPVQKVLVLD